MIESGNGKPRTHSIHDFPPPNKSGREIFRTRPGGQHRRRYCTMYNNHSDFNDENNLYHYSYRDSSQQPPQEPVQDLKPHKEKKPAPRWAKITAIVLAGAIVSGACGYADHYPIRFLSHN